jgi:hypothetical protein
MLTTEEAKVVYDKLAKDCPLHTDNVAIQLQWAIFRLLAEDHPAMAELLPVKPETKPAPTPKAK